MKYSDLKMQIKTGDVLAFSGSVIYSKIIRQWGGFQKWLWEGNWVNDEITHVGLAIWITLPQDDIPDRLCILEAHAFKGVRLNPLSSVLKDDYWPSNGKAYWLPLKDQKLNGTKVAGNGLQYWTKSYAPLKQFVIAGLKIDQWIRKRIGLSVDADSNRVHCSELVTKALIDTGFNYDKDPSITTPQDVFNFPCFGTSVLIEPD